MTREEFYTLFTALLTELRSDLDLSGLEPDTHLWERGYLDSIGMLETIERLEVLVGRPLELCGDLLPTFYTMDRIYEAHIAPGART
ncbi:hypothetical protein [Pseudonocardia spinosispora]|uniref:hypothetical protein n=1 Tax=Pseudonocardia spinosispora TaxID=103441 RepID=UPI00041F1257|nr:hypothetical protein [Pseudonocardia spinosispora]